MIKNAKSWIAAIALAAAGSAHAQTTAPTAQAPQWAAGDEWVYQMSDEVERSWNYKRFESVSAVGADGVPTYSNHNESGSTFQRVTDADGNETLYHGGHFGGDGHKLLSFPLFVGKEWDANYTRGDGSGGSSTVQTHAKVVGYEILHTAAGDLPAYHIDIEGSFQMNSVAGSISRQHETAWYAPSAKRIVKYEFARPPMNRHTGVEWHLDIVSFHVSPPLEKAAQ